MADSAPTDEALSRVRQLARLLDSSIRLPGGYRIGLDGLIGLIPGIGDAAAASISAYIVIQAARMGAPTTTLIRMMGNILLELLVGIVPVLGDLFDFAWKANNRNVALLERNLHRLEADDAAGRRLTSAALVLLGGFLLLIVLMAIGAISVLLALLGALGTG
ncbi:MAG: DUF4112 domain-containing protein [Wenzhouxiangellaceae bacterium]|nr:DUF4112 domain-containing protein [Wenzhouxiangellaceae bacterium]